MSQPSRYSQWQITLPFSLNNDYFGVPSKSHSFITPKTEAIPILAQFIVSGVDPSGSRHLKTHPSFKTILASGTGFSSSLFDALDLNATDISTGSGISKTKVFLFRISSITSPGISRVRNMKLWASDTSDFLTKSDHKILYKSSNIWLQNFVFTPNDITNKSYWLSDSLPDVQNLFRNDNSTIIMGSGDIDVSQYAYVALAASGTIPLGEYGRIVDGHPSGFVLRVTYNIDNIPFG